MKEKASAAARTRPCRPSKVKDGGFLFGLAIIAVMAIQTRDLPAQGHQTAAVEASVVRIFSTIRPPDPYKPWLRQTPVDVTGSGVVIEGNRILTCAHVVLYASQIEVQADQSGEKIPAVIDSIAPAMDLAVLKLEDKSFFTSHPPLPRAHSLPEIKDVVLAYGYPKGGNALSVTKGIVSRIEFVSYKGFTAGLRMQVDTPINPGNSGGPAVVSNKMVGLAASGIVGAQNIGYITPCEEIDLFLEDVADGHYDGKPIMLDVCQGTANPALRSLLKIDKAANGVLVTRPYSTDRDYPLKENDLITQIVDRPLDNEGMIQVNGNLRVFFKYLIQKTVHGGEVPLTIIRNGSTLHIQLPLLSNHTLLIPELAGSYPPYFICGPLVFTKATSQYITGIMSGQLGGARTAVLIAYGSPLIKRMADEPAFDGEELVVISSTFPHKLATGYGSPSTQSLKTLNGTPIKNLEHLVKLIRDSQDQFLVFGLDSRLPELLVFPRREMVAATEDVLADNGIRSQGTPHMLAIWKGGKVP